MKWSYGKKCCCIKLDIKLNWSLVYVFKLYCCDNIVVICFFLNNLVFLKFLGVLGCGCMSKCELVISLILFWKKV